MSYWAAHQVMVLNLANSLLITGGQAGYLTSVYALTIVSGGLLLTSDLARFNKKVVPTKLMVLLTLSNVLSPFSPNYFVLIVS